jgi:Ca2+-binding EF-hand superfamily protein
MMGFHMPGMVKELDLDGDGEIDFSEFTQAITGGGQRDHDEALVDAFEVFDKDGNGFISARELRRVLVGLGYSKCSLRECRLMIRGVDKNGDGMVDFKEFKSMMSLLKEYEIERIC